MKVCETCGQEISTQDGNNQCLSYEELDLLLQKTKQRCQRIAKRNRQSRDQAMRDLGLVKVRGALGGTYWE